MKFEMFIKATRWIMFSLIVISIVSLIVPMAAYMYSGLEIMPAINFGCAISIVAIVSSIVYFVAIAVDSVRAWWMEKQ